MHQQKAHAITSMHRTTMLVTSTSRHIDGRNNKIEIAPWQHWVAGSGTSPFTIWEFHSPIGIALCLECYGVFCSSSRRLTIFCQRFEDEWRFHSSANKTSSRSFHFYEALWNEYIYEENINVTANGGKVVNCGIFHIVLNAFKMATECRETRLKHKSRLLVLRSPILCSMRVRKSRILRRE